MLYLFILYSPVDGFSKTTKHFDTISLAMQKLIRCGREKWHVELILLIVAEGMIVTVLSWWSLPCVGSMRSECLCNPVFLLSRQYIRH